VLHENLTLTPQEKQKEKHVKFLIWMGFFVYVLMMGSKNVYTAEVAAIQIAFCKTKAEASLAMTYYFLTYAIGQVVIAPLFSKINLKYFLTITAGLSSIVTILIGVMPSMELLYVLCTINGVLQAGIYSGVMAIISKYTPAYLLPFANRIMSIGGGIYGVIAYGVPALFVGYGLWNVPFILLGIIFAISVALFYIAVNLMKKYPPEVDDKQFTSKSVSKEPMFMNVGTKGKKVFFFILMGVISLVGSLMYSPIMQWVPSLLNEVFQMPLSYSILITLLAPVAISACSVYCISLCEKYKNSFNVGIVLTLIAVGFFIPMIFFYKVNIVLTLVCLVGYLSISSAGRIVYSSILAFKMRSHIHTGSYLAFLNSIAAVVAGLGPTLAGLIIDFTSYGTLFVIVLVIGIVYLGLLAVCSHMVKSQEKKNQALY
jgi:MFS family permease